MSNSNLEFRKIKSLKFLYEINENGTILRNVKSKKQTKIFLDMHHSKAGYYAALVHIGGRQPGNYTKRVMIHKAVAECWLGDCPEGYEVDHIDRNSHNNHYSNLRYVTHSGQMKNRVLSDRIINQAKANCAKWVKSISKPIILKNGDQTLHFQSRAEAAAFLAETYNKGKDAMRDRFKHNRAKVFDWDVIYPNAETGHTDSTE